MKKILLILSLIAAMSIGGGALASTASAASCSNIAPSSIYYSGSRWHFDAWLQGCSGVNGVEWGISDMAGIPSGIYDNSRATWHRDVAYCGCGYQSYQTLGAAASYYATYNFNVWGSGCGAPAFMVTKQFMFRIRNSSGNTWGSWHNSTWAQQLC